MKYWMIERVDVMTREMMDDANNGKEVVWISGKVMWITRKLCE